jgi:hypothetical protein
MDLISYTMLQDNLQDDYIFIAFVTTYIFYTCNTLFTYSVYSMNIPNTCYNWIQNATDQKLNFWFQLGHRK